MGGFKGRGLRDLTARLDAFQGTLESDAIQIVETTVEEAHNLQVQILEDAVTRTGIRRVAAGGQYAGRIESGHMVGELDFETVFDGGVVRGSWGWPDPEDYFADQDNGTEKIPAANSLALSFLVAREKFVQRLRSSKKGF